MRSQRVARPSLERGMEAASGKNSSTRRRHRGKGRKGQKTPSPRTMCHTPHWASAGRVAFYYFVFLKRQKCIRGQFLGIFGICSGPSQGFSRIRRGIRSTFVSINCASDQARTFHQLSRFFLARARCLLAGLRYLRLTRLPRHDRGPVPGGNRSAASCLCTVLRRALYHYATRSPFHQLSRCLACL